MLTALEPGRGLSYIQLVELPRNTVRVLMMMLAVALAGVLFLQYRMLRNNLALKEESFGRNVIAALNQTAERVEEIDLRDRVFSSADPADSARPGEPHIMRFRDHSAFRGTGTTPDSTVILSVVTSEWGALSAELRGEKLTYRIDGPRKVSIRLFDEVGRLDTTLLDAMEEGGRHDLLLPSKRGEPGVHFIQIRADSATSTLRWDSRGGNWYKVWTDEESRTRKIIGRVAETVSPDDAGGLSARVRPGLLDTLLTASLAANGISLPYRYAVRDIGGDSVVISRMDSGAVVPPDAFSALLFPAGFSGAPGELVLWFPGYTSSVVESILPDLLLSVFFVLIIGVCFRYALRSLRAQREFAGRLSDFINNMTHEFKTPLSTIALSSEALVRPDVVGDRSRVEMYGGIIADEQKRMKSQVDRILDMAALEEGEVEFRESVLDLHEIVTRAAAGSALRVKEAGGSVSTELKAQAHRIRGDAVHIENVVNSVLDNAEKYSPGAPEIRVATRNEDGGIVLSVSDRGAGIAPEHLPNIFEKYFRVPTNNLHDVKGFGLGLSYVKLVVGRHGGTVRALSEPGLGTTIEMTLPVSDG